MVDFFKLWEAAIRQKRMLVLEIGWTTITDYCIRIKDRDNIETSVPNVIINISECSHELAFAKAYVELSQWLLGRCGGY